MKIGKLKMKIGKLKIKIGKLKMIIGKQMKEIIFYNVRFYLKFLLTLLTLGAHGPSGKDRSGTKTKTKLLAIFFGKFYV